MNAREVMQALLDGRTIVCSEPHYPQREYRLREGFIEMKEEGRTAMLKMAIPTMALDCITIEDDSEYRLNFATAMEAAIQSGRRIWSEDSGIEYEIQGGILIYSVSKKPAGLHYKEVAGTWRLVR